MTVRVPIRYEAIGHTGDRAIDLSAENIEVDPSGLTHSSATDLQTLAEDVDGLLGASSTPVQSTDPGTLTIATGQFLIQHARLTLTTTERLTIAGTGRLVMADFASTGAVSAAITSAEAYALALVDDLSGVSDATTARTNLGLGTAATHATSDYDASGAAAAAQAASQPLDSDLTAIAALSTTSFGRAFLALADAAALRTAGGLVIGTDVEAHDTDLTTIAGLTPSNDDVLQRKAGAWTNRTVAQYLSDLGLAALYQPLDSDLTAIAALTTTSTGRSLLAAADAAALRTILALGTAATHATTDYDASGAAATAQTAAQSYADGLVDDLSGVTNASTARTNLGLGAAATKAVGTTTGTVAAGDDSRFTDARTPLGQPLDPGTFTLATEQFVTQYGRLKLSSSERFTIAGTGRLVLADFSYDQAGAATTAAAAAVTTAEAYAAALVDDLSGVTDAATARSNLGLGTAATHATGDYDAAGAAAAAQSASQPLDSDLTAIAALSTTTYGRALLALADGTALAALIPSSVLTNAQLATEAQATIKGRASAAGTGAVTDLSASQVRTIIDTNTTPSTQAIGDTAAVGTADTLARGDHKHTMPAYGTTAGTITQGNDSRLSDARAPLARGLDPGTFTMADEQFVIQYGHLKLSGSERYTMAGTARMVLTDLHAQDSVILGTPKQPTQSFTVPTDWSLDQMFRLSLVNNMRATLQGTADLILTDDFKQRSRLVLS